jgi:hypothetical protein
MLNRYSFSQTTLHVASEKGHLEIVKYLISKGADIDATDVVSFTICVTKCFRIIKRPQKTWQEKRIIKTL